MKQITLVCNTGWYLYNFRFSFLKSLLRKKYSVTLIFPFDKYTDSLRDIGCKVINWKLNRNSINPLKEIYSIIDLIIILNKVKPDISHAFTIKACLYGTIAGRLIGIKNNVNSITGLGHVFLSHKLRTFFLRKFLINVYKLVLNHKNSYLIFQNNQDKELFLKLGIVIENKSILIRGSGVDTKYFKSQKKEVTVNIKNQLKILFPSRIIRQKGIFELTSACKKLYDEKVNLKLIIPSDPEFVNRSALSSKELRGLKEAKWISFIGHVDDIKQIYDDVDLVILPSWREGLAMSLLEASSMECAIITTNVAGCNDIVEHGKSGLLVPLKDSLSILLAVKMFINNPSLKKKFGKAARKNTKLYFNDEIINTQTEKLYISLVGRE